MSPKNVDTADLPGSAVPEITDAPPAIATFGKTLIRTALHLGKYISGDNTDRPPPPHLAFRFSVVLRAHMLAHGI